MNRRRLVAFFTTLAIAWTALWPLVSSAWLVANDESMPLCHQAGMQVTADMPSPPSSSDSPGTPARSKQHCPLCIMAFLAAFEPPVDAAHPPRIDRSAEACGYCAPAPAGITVQLPQPRAPPSVSV